MSKEIPKDDPRQQTDKGSLSDRQALGGQPRERTAKRRHEDRFREMAQDQDALKSSVRRPLMHGSVNDDRSPLLDLMACVNCKDSMKLERIDPDGDGYDLIRYRCSLCGGTEVLRLYRRSR